MKIRMGIGLIALFATVALPLSPLSKPPVAFAQLIIGVVSVIDGDTIEIHGQWLRLHGAGAPDHISSLRGVATSGHTDSARGDQWVRSERRRRNP
jgi:hypothetical protein